jgi:hypothetical protein
MNDPDSNPVQSDKSICQKTDSATRVNDREKRKLLSMQPLIQFKKTTLLLLISLALAWLAAAPTATAIPPLPQARLVNVSTRSFVQTGDNVMIAGFIIGGTGANTVIIRALGPTLGQPPFNVPNVLNNPTLQLFNSLGGLLASNDDWQNTIIGGLITTDQRQTIIDSGLAPTFSSESAMRVTLPQGAYTAIVRGYNNSTGNALVEVYDY